MSWELVTRAEVANLAGQDVATLRDEWYDWVVGILKQETGYEYIEGTTATVTDEAHDGNGTDLLVVKKPPIVSVASLSIGGSGVSSNRYKVYDQYVRMVSTLDDTIPSYFPIGVQNVLITYTSGFTAVPADVKLAVANAIEIIMLHNLRGGTTANIKWSVPERTDGADEPPLPVASLSRVVRNIIRKGIRRKGLRFR